MNPTHLHLILNHFPIIGSLIGMGILAYGMYSKNNQVKISGIFLLVIMALVAIPVFLTGEPAEHAVKNMADISKPMIEEHEEAAELAFWLMEVTGMLALISFFLSYRNSAYAKHALAATLLLSAITFGAMANTGYLGGQVHHSELRSNTTGIQNQQNERGGEQKGDDDDD
jgi:uncharacterized membrane protein